MVAFLNYKSTLKEYKHTKGIIVASSEFEQLVQVVKALRHPDTGCPWDLQQSHRSLLPFLFEESYEFKEAVELEDYDHMQEEIGDVLLQVILHAQLASEVNKFDIESVCKSIREKIVRRHPHVFDNPDGKKITEEEVKKNWNLIKSEEKQDQNYKRAIKKKILNAPALTTANEIGKKTQLLNFDWEDANQVAYKVEEEWQELKEELMPSQINKERVAEELGDFLFSTAQLARHLDLDPEEVLRAANAKFLKRFYKMEDLIVSENKSFTDMTQEQLDTYWNEAKKS
jgi:MazG family protein